MLFHNCPDCDSGRSSRRQFLAGLGAAGCRRDAAGARGARAGRQDPDRHPLPFLSAVTILQMQQEWEGKRNIPRYPAGGRLDAGRS